MKIKYLKESIEIPTPTMKSLRSTIENYYAMSIEYWQNMNKRVVDDFNTIEGNSYGIEDLQNPENENARKEFNNFITKYSEEYTGRHFDANKASDKFENKIE